MSLITGKYTPGEIVPTGVQGGLTTMERRPKQRPFELVEVIDKKGNVDLERNSIHDRYWVRELHFKGRVVVAVLTGPDANDFRGAIGLNTDRPSVPEAAPGSALYRAREGHGYRVVRDARGTLGIEVLDPNSEIAKRRADCANVNAQNRKLKPAAKAATDMAVMQAEAMKMIIETARAGGIGGGSNDAVLAKLEAMEQRNAAMEARQGDLEAQLAAERKKSKGSKEG